MSMTHSLSWHKSATIHNTTVSKHVSIYIKHFISSITTGYSLSLYHVLHFQVLQFVRVQHAPMTASSQYLLLTCVMTRQVPCSSQSEQRQPHHATSRNIWQSGCHTDTRHWTWRWALDVRVAGPIYTAPTYHHQLTSLMPGSTLSDQRHRCTGHTAPHTTSTHRQLSTCM